MARLNVEGAELVVRLSVLEKIGAFRGDVRVPLGAVWFAAVELHPWGALRGIRAPGTGIPGVIAYGVRRRVGGNPDFAALVARTPAVRIDLDESSPFARLVVSVTEAEATVRAVRAAAGI